MVQPVERDSGCEYPFYRPKGHSCMVLSAGVVPNVPNASRIIGPAGKQLPQHSLFDESGNSSGHNFHKKYTEYTVSACGCGGCGGQVLIIFFPIPSHSIFKVSSKALIRNCRFTFSTRASVRDRRGATLTRQFGAVGCILEAILDPLDTRSSSMNLRELRH
jgi:hypothetical protein